MGMERAKDGLEREEEKATGINGVAGKRVRDGEIWIIRMDSIPTIFLAL